MEDHSPSSVIISHLSGLLIRKCFCRLILDSLSCVSCALGISEIILWRSHHRPTSLLFGDILTSLLLLWTLFYEQYSDRILLKIKFHLNNHSKEEDSQIQERKSINQQLEIIPSHQSLVFIMLLIFASFSFIATLLSFKNKGIGDLKKLLMSKTDLLSTVVDVWYFFMGLAFRHLLLIRLCSADLCHWIDILYHNGRCSLRVLSHLLVFFVAVIFICIWIGVSIYITDSSAITTQNGRILAPSRYVYFVYQIILNVGYGDTTEQSILSFIMIIVMTLIACPLLIITYQNFMQELSSLRMKMSHVETWNHTYFVNYLAYQLNRYQHAKAKTETDAHNSIIR